MSKIRIKNFGPIKEGYLEDGGFMDIRKVTVFIGNQGSGKSTVAKVISTLLWMEKAINRGDIKEPKSINDFQKHFSYQGIKGYFKKDTTIEYYGDAYNILFNSEESPYTLTTKNTAEKYIVPKISYVPAERNFLSVIKNATGVKGLPEALFDFAEEFKLAQNEIKDETIPLPINKVSYKYDKETESSFIVGEGYNVNLLVASSGFQSLVPLFLVSSTLGKLVLNDSSLRPININVTQIIRLNEERSKIVNNNGLSDSEKIRLSKELELKFINKCFVNIVEEPEQNLFPSSQQKLLNSLLAFNNLTKENKLLITTHSPFLVNYLTLAVKANIIYNILKDKNYKLSDPEFGYVDEIVPMASSVAADDIIIYELDEKDGIIKKLGNFEGIPSDSNFLNKSLGQTNLLFDSLLEIEEGL